MPYIKELSEAVDRVLRKYHVTTEMRPYYTIR